MKPTSPAMNLITSADDFQIAAFGQWTLRGDALRLTEQPELRTTSLAVATVFGKRHNDVLRAIRNMECSEEFRRQNFKEATYLVDTAPPLKIEETPQRKIALRGIDNTSLQARPMVEMTRQGFEFLVLGFTGKKAAAFRESYVTRFHQMEAELLKKTNEIQRLARFNEHMPAINGMDWTCKPARPYRIANKAFKPIHNVEIIE